MGAQQKIKLKIKTPRWADQLIKNPGQVRYRCAYGGRGSGKSHFFAESIVERCILDKTDVICGREVQKSLKHSAKRLIEQKIQDLGVGHIFDARHDRILAPYGGIIIFEGLKDHNSESIKSLEGFDIFWGEEANAFSQNTLDLIRPTIRKESSDKKQISELWFSWNPKNASDPIEKLFRSEYTPGNSIIVKTNYYDNPWFPDVLKTEMEYDKSRDLDKYTHIWLGGYVKNSESRVFNNWTVEEFETPKDAEFRQGADWGFSVDPTVLIRCFVEGRKLYIDNEAYQIGCEINNIPLLFNQVPDSERWPIIADNNRPDTISYLNKHGYPKIYGAAKGQGSIEEGIEWLKNYDIVVHPRCIHTIDELTMYSYKVDKSTGHVLPILEDKNNHVIDALRYANEGTRRVKKSQTYDNIKLNFSSEF